MAGAPTRGEVGDRVRAGQTIARCGNSGNSSEPHLHLQLMDGPSITRAAGLPFALSGTALEGEGGQRHPRAVVPGSLQCFAPTDDALPGADHGGGSSDHALSR